MNLCYNNSPLRFRKGEYMALENLYALNKSEIALIYKDLADNFYNDELYMTIFPSEKYRKQALEVFFKEYIKAISPYCTFYADSVQRLSVMVVYDSRTYSKLSYFRHMASMNLRLLKLFSVEPSALFNAMKCWDMFTSRWVKNFVNKEYFHLDLLFTNKNFRMQGLASKMLIELVRDAQNLNMDITMETHNKDNLPYYQQFGFILMNTITDPNYNLKEYCMMIRNDRK